MSAKKIEKRRGRKNRRKAAATNISTMLKSVCKWWHSRKNIWYLFMKTKWSAVWWNFVRHSRHSSRDAHASSRIQNIRILASQNERFRDWIGHKALLPGQVLWRTACAMRKNKIHLLHFDCVSVTYISSKVARRSFRARFFWVLVFIGLVTHILLIE